MNVELKKSMWFILITVMIDSTGLGIIIPVLPQLIAHTTGTTLSEAAKYNGILFGCYALMQFIFSPIMGGLSDRFGRKPVLLISLFGLAIDYIFLALAPDLICMVLGRSISGICGSSFTTASAYIADISKPEDRAKNFGFIGAFFGLGFILGPAIGGLLSNYGIRTPFFVSALLSLLNTIYGLVILSESLPIENRREFDIKRANPLCSLLYLRLKPNFIWLFAAFFLFNIANISVQSTWNFFTTQKFSWLPSTVGWSLTFIGVAIAIVQGGLIRKLLPVLGNEKAALTGILFSAFGLLGFAIASHGWLLFVFMIPFALGGFVEPAIKGAISAQTSPNEQGELQGTFASLLSLGQIISPLIMTTIYYYTSKSFNLFGSPYYLGCGIMILIIPLILKGYQKLVLNPYK